MQVCSTMMDDVFLILIIIKDIFWRNSSLNSPDANFMGDAQCILTYLFIRVPGL